MKITFLILTCFSLLFMVPGAVAEVLVTDARVKAPVPGQQVIAGYMRIVNTGETRAVVVGVSSEASKVEMHTHQVADGMMTMVRLDSVDIAVGSHLLFVEGGHHLMIFDPDSVAIDSGEVVLHFDLDNGDQVTAIAQVEQLVKHKHSDSHNH